jgi:hypothetical protein
MVKQRHEPGPPMTLGNKTNAEEYRESAEQEAALAKAAITNESRADHYAMAAYYTRLAEAKERLARMTEPMTGDASGSASLTK